MKCNMCNNGDDSLKEIDVKIYRSCPAPHYDHNFFNVCSSCETAILKYLKCNHSNAGIILMLGERKLEVCSGCALGLLYFIQNYQFEVHSKFEIETAIDGKLDESRLSKIFQRISDDLFHELRETSAELFRCVDGTIVTLGKAAGEGYCLMVVT